MNFQDLANAISDAARDTRSDYHLTLSQLIKKLEGVSPGLSVRFSSGGAPGDADSYRGYYSDLAFEPTERDVTVGDLLDRAKSALNATFGGYKGGNFVMGPETPLWAARYGDCGLAIVDFQSDGTEVILRTKDTD